MRKQEHKKSGDYNFDSDSSTDLLLSRKGKNEWA